MGIQYVHHGHCVEASVLILLSVKATFENMLSSQPNHPNLPHPHPGLNHPINMDIQNVHHGQCYE